MKKFKFFLGVCFLSIQFAFAQDKALYIDQNGNVGINTGQPAKTLDVNGSVNIAGDLNGVKIYQFNSNQSPYVLKGMGQNFSTLNISFYVNCQAPGIGAIVFYDAGAKKFRIIGQAGSGTTNRVEVSTSSPNTLNFYNDCGTTVTLTFTNSGSDVTATMTTVNPVWAQFKIISQGF